MNALLRHTRTVLQLFRLPVAQLQFLRAIEPEHVPATYRYYTKRHPRYKIIRHKTIGAALIDLAALNSRTQYLDTIRGKNNGAHHARRAQARGYVCTEIDRNRHLDDIHAINVSQPQRQGRPMDRPYHDRHAHFDSLRHFRYYGVLDREGRLVAYANLGLYGNFWSFSQLIGLRNNDGIMHLLVVDIVSRLIEERAVRYLMYDTFFGARPGMQSFKRMLGFRPYRAKYSLL